LSTALEDYKLGDSINAITLALLPVIFVIALGWFAGYREYLKRQDAHVLATFVVRFALPIALFVGVLQATPKELENVPYFCAMAIGLMGIYFIALGVGLWIFKGSLREASLMALVSAFPDMAFFGVPVLQAVIGPEGLLAVLVGNLVTSIFMIPITMLFLESGFAGSDANQKLRFSAIFSRVAAAFLQPLVWLPILGAVLALTGLHLPTVIRSSLDQIGKAAGGTGLFALGLMIYGLPLRLDWQITACVLLKNVAQPVLMALTVIIFRLRWPLSAELILIGALPSATAGAMIAERYEAFQREGPTAILVSTLLSILTVAVAIALVGSFPK
jgi:malonate transporter and related proteins